MRIYTNLAKDSNQLDVGYGGDRAYYSIMEGELCLFQKTVATLIGEEEGIRKYRRCYGSVFEVPVNKLPLLSAVKGFYNTESKPITTSIKKSNFNDFFNLYDLGVEIGEIFTPEEPGVEGINIILEWKYGLLPKVIGSIQYIWKNESRYNVGGSFIELEDTTDIAPIDIFSAVLQYRIKS